MFNELKNIDSTLIFYETAPRLLKTLEQAAEIFSGRKISVIRELTKMYEEVQTGSFAEVQTHFAENEPKGEFVFIVAPPEEPQYAVADIKDVLAKRLQKTTLKSAVRELSEQFGLNKNEVYALALELKNE